LKAKHWLVFITLGAIWSSSFLWIKIAVQELGPVTVVAYRSLFGVLFAGSIVFIRRLQWPRGGREWFPFIVLGLTNIAIPIFLITWGEQYIDSAVASILNATVPLFALVIAHFMLQDDKMTLNKVVGILIGFVGVVFIMGKDISVTQNSAWGQLAVIVASMFYAFSGVYARKNTTHVEGIVRGASPLVSAALIMGISSFLLESPVKIPALPITWIALLWLGILGSGLAFMMLYYLFHEIGPTRASMITYIFPVGGVILGVAFLDELLTWQFIAGMALIIISLIVVNRKSPEAKTK
jgi:drug/metabolite transporter (DMT)-like permease